VSRHRFKRTALWLVTDRWGDAGAVVRAWRPPPWRWPECFVCFVPGPVHVPGLPFAVRWACCGRTARRQRQRLQRRAVMTCSAKRARHARASARLRCRWAAPIGALFLPSLAVPFRTCFGVRRLAFSVGGGAKSLDAVFYLLWSVRTGCKLVAKDKPPKNSNIPSSNFGASEGPPAVAPRRRYRPPVRAAGSTVSLAPCSLHDFTTPAAPVVTTAMATAQCGAMIMRVWSGPLDRPQAQPARIPALLHHRQAIASLPWPQWCAGRPVAKYRSRMGTLLIVCWCWRRQQSLPGRRRLYRTGYHSPCARIAAPRSAMANTSVSDGFS